MSEQDPVLSVLMRPRDMVPGRAKFLSTGQPRAVIVFRDLHVAANFINNGLPATGFEDLFVDPRDLKSSYRATTGDLGQYAARFSESDLYPGAFSMSLYRSESHRLPEYAVFGDFLYHTLEKTVPALFPEPIQ